MQKAQLIVVSAPDLLGQVVSLVFAEPQPKRKSFQDGLAEMIQTPEEIERKASKAGEDVFGEPDIGLDAVRFGPDLVAFLRNGTSVNVTAQQNSVASKASTGLFQALVNANR